MMLHLAGGTTYNVTPTAPSKSVRLISTFIMGLSRHLKIDASMYFIARGEET
jgi:hypothetical protein